MTDPSSRRTDSGRDRVTRARAWRTWPRWARWLSASVLALVALAVIAATVASPLLSRLARRQLVHSLERRFDSRVEIARLDVSIVPWPRASGQGLTVTPSSRRSDQPPLVTVRTFTVSAGYLGFFRSPVAVGEVLVEGGEIVIVPDEDDGGERRAAGGGGDRSPEIRVHVDRIVARDLQLRIVPREPDKSPRLFDIREVMLRSVGRTEPMAFEAALVNPLPRGEILASGSFGPWNSDAPGRTAVDGQFTFGGADLGTIRGLHGLLDASGQFDGTLERIHVTGETRTPEFGLTVSDQRLPLTTRFDATVDGTNGDTILQQVDARLLDTPILCAGKVADVPDGEGREVVIDATIEKGRIEDLLRLVVKGGRPVMRGAVGVKTSFVIPPGPGDVVERIALEAQVRIDDARFTVPSVQSRINELSARGRGDAKRAEAAKQGPAVASDMSVHARLKQGVLTLTPVTFRVEGASVRLIGSYGLQSERIDLRGAAVLDAKVSQTMTGWKSWFLKLADPLFRHKGGGSEVPIAISGTREQPKFGLDVKRAILP